MQMKLAVVGTTSASILITNSQHSVVIPPF